MTLMNTFICQKNDHEVENKEKAKTMRRGVILPGRYGGNGAVNVDDVGVCITYMTKGSVWG